MKQVGFGRVWINSFVGQLLNTDHAYVNDGPQHAGKGCAEVPCENLMDRGNRSDLVLTDPFRSLEIVSMRIHRSK